MTSPNSKSSNELAQERTNLAVERTLMAASRSLMAWVRTALSMIGFGFTIYKFLKAEAQNITFTEPKTVGLFLIGLGVVSIVFGIIEYRQTAGLLRQNYGTKFRKFPLIMAASIGGLGVALLISALF